MKGGPKSSLRSFLHQALQLFLVLDSFYFVLFCIISHGGQIIHELSKISLFLA